MILEYCCKGDLIAFLTSDEGKIGRNLRLQIVQDLGLVISIQNAEPFNCDLKPASILESDAKDGPRFKISDFGLAGQTNSMFLLSSNVGTAFYIAPEILSASYSKSVGIFFSWSRQGCFVLTLDTNVYSQFGTPLSPPPLSPVKALC